MTTGVGNTLTMDYDGLRRLISVTGGPVIRQYTYRDIDSAKTTMQVASVTSGGQQFGYTYDSMGNIATYSAPGKATVTYTYDNQGQLLKAAGDTTYTYTYDGAGNILTANGHTYTYGDANWKDLLTVFDGQAITYDAIGNPTSYYNGTSWDFTWANGRSLTTASGRTYNLSFTYDANGLRTSKTDGGIVYRYYYAGEKLIRMTWGANIVDLFYDVNGTPYAMKRNGFVYYYITNLQGDVLKLVDASGNVVASYEYDPYGKVLSATGSFATINPLLYRGYVYDRETGFYYLQSRYYDPAIGRFINADSYASTGQDIIGYNMFTYCGSNPVNKVDPTGHMAIPMTIAATNSWNALGWGAILLLVGVLAVDALSNSKTVGAQSKPLVLSEDEREMTGAIADVAVADTEQTPVFYGVDLYHGDWKFVTAPMQFQDAANWAIMTASSGKYSSRASWGLYTEKQSDAMAMAIYLGGPGPVYFDEAFRNHRAHFHTVARMIMDNNFISYCAQSFHIWYGAL